MSRTLKITLSYKGEAFCGFARQPGLLTVQGNLEDALAVVFARPLLTVCAGRTDAGVHALSQVVSLDVEDDDLSARSFPKIIRSLNALTHDDITVKAIEEAWPGFSARFDALEREYRYFICDVRETPLFMRDFCWVVGCPLDVEAMYEASRALIGEHDFKSFCLAASAKDKSTFRCVNDISFSREAVFGEPMLVITVKGNAFLHSMVRTIVGSLVLVGKHQREISWIKTALMACDRAAAGETAPARGLVFWNVTYGTAPRESIAAQNGADKADIADGGQECAAPRESAQEPREAHAVIDSPGTFARIYESRDGKLCVFRDNTGHLVSVDSSRLA